MNHCFMETLPSRCCLSGKGISAAVYRTVGVRCQPGPPEQGWEDLASWMVASTFSLMTRTRGLNNSMKEGGASFSAVRSCHGLEHQSFHRISQYLQRTLSCGKKDKSLTRRLALLVLVNYFRRVALC